MTDNEIAGICIFTLCEAVNFRIFGKQSIKRGTFFCGAFCFVFKIVFFSIES